MINSLTGYGLHRSSINGKTITVEIKSVNSKFLDLQLKIARSYASREWQLRQYLQLLERGKVLMSITAEEPGNMIGVPSMNKAAVLGNLQDISDLAVELKIPISPADALKQATALPNVFMGAESEATEEEWQGVMKAIEQALGNFNDFRRTEGKTQEADLKERIQNIDKFLKEVEVLEPQRIPAIKERLRSQIADLQGNDGVDGNRLEQELIFFVEKLDISEEKVRLRSHLDYFLKTMTITENSGKKLGFISQEIGREINTLGSKANNAQIQQWVVQMKDELEKIKEQLANVL